ncbi:MAG: molybdopterin cofactor-binding domain-containing protein [Parvibaculaceae bacterium]
MTIQNFNLTRRSMLKGAAALVIGVHIAPRGIASQAIAAEGPVEANAFVRIGSDSTVTVLVKHLEMGQGPLTGLTTLVAEELDADWSQMRAEHAPSNPELYKNLLFGIQGTGGSTAIANSFEQMRKAGATARALLVQAAAESWNVKSEEITVERGVIRHAGASKEGKFGDFVEAAMKLKAPAEAPLKEATNFTYIGKTDAGVKRLDSLAKSTGKAEFTIDIHKPGMLTVVVAHPPRFGGKVKSFDAKEALAVKGVVDVKAVPSGVAVYAEGMWPAIKGREALKVEWDDSSAEKRGSEELIASYKELAAKPGQTTGTNGNVDEALKGLEKVVEAEFVFPYLAHAPLEPLDGYMEWDGSTAKARFGSQLQTGDHGAIAKVLGVPMEKVSIETMFAGGSFGRRAQQTAHLAAELAEVAKAIGPGKPVKLVWTREDDIRGGYYRPIYVHRFKGGIKDGKIAAWQNTVVGQSIVKGSSFEGMMENGIDPTSVEGARTLLYDIADFRCDLHTTDVGVPVLWWRSVGHTHTGYAVECFVDELLEEAGLDPVEGRLAMMGKSPRAAGVLKAVAELADWKGYKVPEGRARGVAVVESFSSFVAQIAEVSAGESGEGPRVHKVWCAVDCGIAVNPDIIRAQMEGGIGYGVGHALYGEISLDEGKVVQGNFDTYRSLRISEMPEVEVAIVPSTEKPTGVGEPGVPPVAPAIANAMAKLGLGRPRRLPIAGGTV